MNFKSRRTFLATGFLSTVMLITYSGELFGAVTPLQTISLVQKDLFPSTSLVPSATEINAKSYLIKILAHSRVTQSDKEYIKNGARWLNEEAVSIYGKVYTKLSSKQRQKVLKEIAETSWGESWIKSIMSYIFEAMLGDPVYGGNVGESGWKWLNHQGGLPRPKKALL